VHSKAIATLTSEQRLASAAIALHADRVPTWSSEERSLARAAAFFSDEAALSLIAEVERGNDPLGEAFC
jgi:hypothetical protein